MNQFVGVKNYYYSKNSQIFFNELYDFDVNRFEQPRNEQAFNLFISTELLAKFNSILILSL